MMYMYSEKYKHSKINLMEDSCGSKSKNSGH